MPRKVHVAVARVYGSASSYGKEPFAVPAGSPLEIAFEEAVLTVHFGEVPHWLRLAEGRVSILGAAMLQALFQGDPPALEQFNRSMSVAEPASWHSSKHKWLVTLVLKVSAEWPDDDDGTPWLWFRSSSLGETLREAQLRVPTLDLASRVVQQSLKNSMDELVVTDRVLLARTASFDDAIPVPQPQMGSPTVSVTMNIATLEAVITGPDLSRSLGNALAAPAVPQDHGRADRLGVALRRDRLLDSGGTYGRYELLRELQPPLMLASDDHPLAVLFVDMNGLGEINKEHGHDAGDEAIDAFRQAVREVHKGDLYRTGGDEFVLFQSAFPANLSDLGRRLLRAVALRSVRGQQLTASIGIARATDPRESPASIVKRADHLGLAAKSESKKHNPRVCVMAVEGNAVEVVR